MYISLYTVPAIEYGTFNKKNVYLFIFYSILGLKKATRVYI